MDFSNGATFRPARPLKRAANDSTARTELPEEFSETMQEASKLIEAAAYLAAGIAEATMVARLILLAAEVDGIAKGAPLMRTGSKLRMLRD